MAENEGTLYCQSCHRRSFGLKGYGYGGGAGTLASEAGGHESEFCSISSGLAGNILLWLLGLAVAWCWFGVLFDHIWRCLLKLPGAGNDWNADLTL